MFIHESFESAVLKFGPKTALVMGERKISYQELSERSDQIAGYLLRNGIRPGDIVGISLERSFDLVASLIGILKAGAVYLPLDKSYPADRLQYMKEHSGASFVLSDKDLAGLESYQFDSTTVDRSKIHGAYLIYTSGSTGRPKGVTLSHKALMNLILWQNQETSLKEDSVTLQYTPISFDVHFQEIFSTLTLGGELVLIDEQMRLDPVSLLNHIAIKKINRIYLPYVALKNLCETGVNLGIYPTTIKEVTTAGEQLKITPEIRNFFGELVGTTLFNHYGPSETHVVTSLPLTGHSSIWPNLPSIGKCISNSKILLLDENLSPVQDGAEGEIFITGDCLGEGYINSPELTAERFVTLEGVGRAYRTGDLGIKEGENYKFLGRKDGQVKVRGYRIEPGEIELAVQKVHPGIQCVVSIHEEDGDKDIVAYITGECDIPQLKDKLKIILPDYMIPSFFVHLESLPLTPSGKVNYKQLPPPERNRRNNLEEYCAPEGKTEVLISKVWQKILKMDQVGALDRFFDLGGNSLLAIRMLVELKKHFPDLTITDVFSYPTIRSLSNFIENDSSSMSESAEESAHESEIAIIAMTGRFPGAGNVDEFWQNIMGKKNCVEMFTSDELHPYINPELAFNKDYVLARGLYPDQESFDYKLFGVNPREAELMDPQQRKFLELSYEALELSGYNPEKYRGAIGVFAGMGNSKYSRLVDQYPDKVEEAGDFNVMLGLEKDYIATRTAYKLNLTGPALSLHAGCSTSLVAIIEAVKSLRQRNCDMAIAGGISISGIPSTGHLSLEGGILSRDGVCRPFDEKATGTVFTDGGGVIVLKRLNDAIKDNDNILAVIKGVGINNDGADKMSFTAPSVKGQVNVIRKAHRDAGIDPKTIGHIETHGTATPVGDPIEVAALAQVFKSNDKHCVLSSIKANVGHLTAAAGVAGVIKTVLSLRTGIIPGSTHFDVPNKNLNLDSTPFVITNVDQKYITQTSPKRAGVSSFGVGGTNAHIVLEEYIPNDEANGLPQDSLLFKLSAKSEAQVEEMTNDLLHILKERPSSEWPSISYTLDKGRKEYSFRRAILTDGKEVSSVCKGKIEWKQELIWMFPGQGAQYVHMGRELYLTDKNFAAHFDECNDILKAIGGYDLKELIFSDDEEKLNNTFYTQPALFLMEYSLGSCLRDLGLEPDAMVGHSIGEFAAATLAGVFSLKDGVKIIAKRADLVNKVSPGRMISIAAKPEAVKEYIKKYKLDIAAVNGTFSTVVAGEISEINKLREELGEKGVASVELKTSHAFHSRMMKEVRDEFHHFLETIPKHRPQYKMYSTVTTNLEVELFTKSHYWADHLLNPVLFAPTVEAIGEKIKPVFLEIGPGSVLSSLVQKIKIQTKKTLSLLPKGKPEAVSFMKALGELWCLGKGIQNSDLLYLPENRRRTIAPTYRFERNKVWLDYKIQNSKPLVREGNNMAAQNKDFLRQKIAEIFEASSGIDVNSFGHDVTFLEMGMDSLFLTQVSLKLRKELKADITFRQLLEEYSTVNLLADALGGSSVEVYSPKPSSVISAPEYIPEPEIPTVPVTVSIGGSSLECLINRQLELMNEQLKLLKGGKVATSTSTNTTVATPEKKASVPEIKKPREAFGAQARIVVDKGMKFTPHQQLKLQSFFEQYSLKTKSSKEFTQKNRRVHADPRVVTGFKPENKEIVYPVVVNRSLNQKLYDLDGNEYIDMTCGFGSNFFGNGNIRIKKYMMDQINAGIEIGPQHPLVGEVSELVKELTGNDRTAFCNTGSEAVLGAMRIARTVTGREKIVVFSGSYHGINDEVIIRKSNAGKPFPAAPGIHGSAVSNMIVLDYGTDESLQIIRDLGEEVAAVLVEPVQSRRCDFHPKEFLREVRNITLKNNTCLIFDEVITGFRIHPGGAQAHFGIRADLCCYGKIIGGGMPIGAISGKSEWMDALDGGFWQYGDDSTPTAGVTYFAGTFVRHPLALAAAKGALEIIKQGGEKQLDDLNKRAQKFVDEINSFCISARLPLEMNNFGSLMKPKWKQEIPGGEILFALLRYHGVHVYDGFPWFVNLAHTQEELDSVIFSFKKAVAEMQIMGLLPETAPVFLNPMKVFDQNQAPVEGAKLGKDENGNPAWFIENPNKAGEYFLVEGNL